MLVPPWAPVRVLAVGIDDEKIQSFPPPSIENLMRVDLDYSSKI